MGMSTSVSLKDRRRKLRDFRGFRTAIVFSPIVLQDPVFQRSLRCFETSTSNNYTTALMAYVFSLAGDIQKRDLLLKDLDSVASQEGKSEELKGPARV